MGFKNAIDIMLFRSPEEEITLKEDQDRLEETTLPVKSSSSASALDFLFQAFGFSARDAHARTREQIRINAEKAIREESTEILEKALLAIQDAISDERFLCDLGGPGRPEPGRYALKQSYSEYREDSRRFVTEHLRAMGYLVKEVEGISLCIDWSKPLQRAALELARDGEALPPLVTESSSKSK